MRDLARNTHLAGRPVPVPWKGLAELVKPRGQNLMLVLAAGGVGKSAFSLEWVMSLEAPSLYISLDTSLVDHGIRVLARHTGLSVEQVAEGHDADPKGWAETWGAVLSDDVKSRARFTDQPSTLREVGEVVKAETEYWGEAPLVTVVDNVGDLLEHEEGAAEYRRVLLGLKRIAMEHDTFVIALHHLRKKPPRQGKRDRDEEDDDEGTQPVHISDALYESDKHAQFVLGLWRPQWNRMTVGVLKNRMGPASRNGGLRTHLYADLRTMRIMEERP